MQILVVVIRRGEFLGILVFRVEFGLLYWIRCG
jgi:hypothetical protein